MRCSNNIIVFLLIVVVALLIWGLFVNNAPQISLVSTVVLALLTGIYVIYTSAIAKASSDQLSLIKEISINEKRPWLTVDIENPLDVDVHTHKVTLRLSPQNYGHQPGILTSVDISIGVNDQNNQQQSVQRLWVYPTSHSNSKQFLTFRSTLCETIGVPQRLNLKVEIGYIGAIDGIHYTYTAAYELTRVDSRYTSVMTDQNAS